MYKIKIDNFQGPLDLLLQLIDQQKLEITEVSLSAVTDQYIDHLEGVSDLDPEELSDFLVIAARLLFLKSKAVLPMMDEEEVVDDLEKQLKIYKQFLVASQWMAERLKETHFSYKREKPPVRQEVRFSPAKNMTDENMHQSFLRVLKRLDPIVRMPKQMMERAVSLKKTIMDLRTHFQHHTQMSFKKVFETAENKTELIVGFLAMLELVKQRFLVVEQNDTFDDIVIKKI